MSLISTTFQIWYLQINKSQSKASAEDFEVAEGVVVSWTRTVLPLLNN